MEAEADDILARVRAAREALAARFNFDLNAICADLRARQGQDGRVVLPAPPRPQPEPDPVVGEVSATRRESWVASRAFTPGRPRR